MTVPYNNIQKFSMEEINPFRKGESGKVKLLAAVAVTPGGNQLLLLKLWILFMSVQVNVCKR